ncbi:uncharacterized protein LOC126834167 isoform X2 [Adelges cooleyi]|uniref:uncharacterized protein LOC126834167 isoform X2 n=1 Tax=Adelges cooleyi TaxID=133065 RepID=UPI0021807CEE|nr:uncharacterized protein LOC126834167 isoform X2 [Adelges cooleyi]
MLPRVSLILATFSVLSASDTNPADGHLLVEHTVTQESAQDAIQHLQPDLMIGAGCKECTRREIEYCMSNDVIEDHCCCQRKYHEVFPYIAHTCYVRSRNCEPTVRDCGVFDRLLACCCHQHLGTKYKSQLLAANSSSIDGQNEINVYLSILGLHILYIKSNFYL